MLEGILTATKSALRALPPCNYLTLKYLVGFLDEVQRVILISQMELSRFVSHFVFSESLSRFYRNRMSIR